MDRFQQELNAIESMRRILGPFAEAVLVNTPQGRYLVPADDLYVGASLRITGAYAAPELGQLRGFCNAGTRLLVVGANIGALAIPLAKNCREVVAIEANPQTFDLLRLNVMLNGLSNCRVIQKAAGSRVELIEFVQNRANPGGSKRKPVVELADYFYDNPKIVQVEAAPLDDLLAGEEFGVVLMDIEGSEYFALQGMQRILATTAVLQVEFLPHHLRNVAGVSVEQFVALIEPHFASLCIARKALVVGRDRFVPLLREMYDRNEGDEGLIFLKTPPETIRFHSTAPVP